MCLSFRNIDFEGFNQRFNPAAVAFLQEVFIFLLIQKLCATQFLSSDILSAFEPIRILDTTVFQLPDSFTIDYQGSGGSRNIVTIYYFQEIVYPLKKTK